MYLTHVAICNTTELMRGNLPPERAPCQKYFVASSSSSELMQLPHSLFAKDNQMTLVVISKEEALTYEPDMLRARPKNSLRLLRM